MPSSISLTNTKFCFNIFSEENHDIESLTEFIIKDLSKKLNAKSGQFYLYSGEPHVLKCIYKTNSSEIKSYPTPKNNALLIEKDCLIFPISNENILLGIMTFESIKEKTIQENLTELTLLHSILGSKISLLVEKEKLQNRSRIINEHLISFELSDDGKIIQPSKALVFALGYSQEELIGQPLEKISYTEERLLFSKSNSKKTIQGEELKLQKKNGQTLWVNSKSFPLKTFLGEGPSSFCLYQDISQQKIVEDMAIKDDLTSLYNRRFFNQIFIKEIERSHRNKQNLAFMLIDIDNFKKYNDTYGHQEGDRVLAQVAQTISSCFKRKEDFSFRLGGEEFGILCNITKPEDGEIMANISRMAIENLAIPHTGNSYKVVTISIGVYIYNSIEKTITPDEDEIYKTADIALYEAKEKGRNKVIIAGLKDDIELF